jgi:hypothetical protein
MLNLMLATGLGVALAGVFQVTRRHRGPASDVTLLQDGVAGLEGPDAEAFRAEFRRSGVALPERPPLGRLV